jgi:polyphosphate kinase 2 (PPK2 family)
MTRLDELDLSLKLSREEEAARLEAASNRLLELRLTLGGLLGDGRLGPPVCVLFEGWDASGKGGAIRRLVLPMDPRHVRVATFAAPTYDEKRHHFLWRFWSSLPGWGGMAVLDRSWYGRVLVERVEGFATVEQWTRGYGEIVEYERSLVLEGMILLKFWMHISEEEQLRRFKRRETEPLKSWKLTTEDWRNREKRTAYEQAIEDMLERTDHPWPAGTSSRPTPSATPGSGWWRRPSPRSSGGCATVASSRPSRGPARGQDEDQGEGQGQGPGPAAGQGARPAGLTR